MKVLLKQQNVQIVEVLKQHNNLKITRVFGVIFIFDENKPDLFRLSLHKIK